MNNPEIFSYPRKHPAGINTGKSPVNSYLLNSPTAEREINIFRISVLIS
jgi:hypothetical protein